MACHLIVHDTAAKSNTEHVCDEDNTTRIVEDDHAGSGSGEYADTNGKTFSVDWTKCQLIGFSRKGDA